MLGRQQRQQHQQQQQHSRPDPLSFTVLGWTERNRTFAKVLQLLPLLHTNRVFYRKDTTYFSQSTEARALSVLRRFVAWHTSETAGNAVPDQFDVVSTAYCSYSIRHRTVDISYGCLNYDYWISMSPVELSKVMELATRFRLGCATCNDSRVLVPVDVRSRLFDMSRESDPHRFKDRFNSMIELVFANRGSTFDFVQEIRDTRRIGPVDPTAFRTILESCGRVVCDSIDLRLDELAHI